ncbi:MAG TPA: hypothetical protein VKF80_10195 [Candidatus Eisenbacteria bacterium]|nr:hypothetical protein [Candidatus Eisenbacteria bacterium]
MATGIVDFTHIANEMTRPEFITDEQLEYLDLLWEHHPAIRSEQAMRCLGRAFRLRERMAKRVLAYWVKRSQLLFC